MKLKHIFSCFLLMLLFLKEGQAQKFNLVIGTYTKSGKSEGIYVYEFDSRTGKAIYKNKAAGLNNPSYLAISKNGKFVYAVSEAAGKTGEVKAFSFDKKSGQLNLLNSHSSGGSGPCYISVDDKNRHVFVANYSAGSFSAVPLAKDGSFAEGMQTIVFKGSGADSQRQQAPHAHSSVLSPDNKFLFVSDLGTDKIHIYQYHPGNAETPLSNPPIPFITTDPGSGPRHFDFHPTGRFAYSVQELNGTVSAYQYQNGRLSLLQNISILPANTADKIGAADIHVSPDGKFLYASNRGQLDEIIIFSIEENRGQLRFVGRQSTLGKTPRNFVIDPTGNFLLVGNQNSDEVVIFKRDKVSGLLKDTGERLELGSPVCLKFTAAN